MTSDPWLLAFDTSTSLGSVAVARGTEVVARGFLTHRKEHAARLIPLVSRVLGNAGVTPAELDGLVVGKGPGSFTGVRIAAATAKGMARALECPLWLHSSLAAGAASFGAEIPASVRPSAPTESIDPMDPRPRWVLFDARGDRLYAACYSIAGGGVESIMAPRACTVDDLIEVGPGREAVFCGDGALRHAEALSRTGRTVIAYPAGLPTAEGLLWLHSVAHASPAVGSRWEPDYLRGSSAARPASSERSER